MQGDRRRGIRKPNAQQSLLEGAAIARRAERRRLAGLVQQGGDGQAAQGAAEQAQGASVAWVGCQWLMDGYCGRVEETQVPRSTPQPQEQGGGDNGQSTNDTDPPQRPNRAA